MDSNHRYPGYGGASVRLAAAAMQPETSQPTPSADFLVPRGHAFGGHAESKNPVEFRPWSYEFDGNRNARAM
jgi:hypothetical protein